MTTSAGPQTARVNGVDLRYIEAGAGDPPIVFVHGWTCNRTDWRHQVAEFSQRHRVIALDQRGHGESDKPDQDYTMEGFADDLAAFIEQLGLERPVIVGHSMGGVITHDLVRRHPGIARGVVQVDSTIVPIDPALQPTVEATLAGLRSEGYRDVARGFVTAFMFNSSSDEALKEAIIGPMLEAPQYVITSALESLIAQTSRYEGPMPVPTLYLQAATSVYQPDAITARYPGIELKRIDAAHFLQLEQPDEVNAAIRGFVEGLEDA